MTQPARITVEPGTWASMSWQLLDWAFRQAGSVRRAAELLEVPRATLGCWLKRRPRVRPSAADDAPTHRANAWRMAVRREASDRGLSLADLARSAGVDTTALARQLNGGNVTLDDAIDVLLALGLDPTEVLT